MARLRVAPRGDTVRIEGVSDGDDPEHDLYQNGALLPGPHATLAGPGFEEWLGSREGVVVAPPVAHASDGAAR